MKAQFKQLETLEIGESDVPEFYSRGCMRHPGCYIFYCPKCGSVWGRISVAGGDWMALRQPCKQCGSQWPDGADTPGILYNIFWEDAPEHLNFYPEFVLRDLFLHELKYYEEGK